MKQKVSLVLLSCITALGLVAALGLSTHATSLVASSQPAAGSLGMLGHVEYIVTGSDGEIVRYMQGDNIIVSDGYTGVARTLFGGAPTTAAGTTFNSDIPNYTYIAIGNHTTGPTVIDDATGTVTSGLPRPAVTDQRLGGVNSGTPTLTFSFNAYCASSAGRDVNGNIPDDAAETHGGEMARRQGTVTITPATESTDPVIQITATPFSFDASNATNVIDTGLFNDEYLIPGSADPDDVCSDEFGFGLLHGTPSTHMFARNTIGEPGVGFDMNAGETLDVIWTVSLGGNQPAPES